MAMAGQRIGEGLAKCTATHPLFSESTRRISRVSEVVGAIVTGIFFMIALLDYMWGEEEIVWPCLAIAAAGLFLPVGIHMLLWKWEKKRGIGPPDDPEQPCAPQ